MKYWTCPDAATGITSTLSGDDVPTCASGQGSWTEAPIPWFAYVIPADQLQDLFAAQLMFFAVMLVCNKLGQAISDKYT